MLRMLNNNRAQAALGEYLLLIFIVTGSIISMSLYFRRALQARIYDSRNMVVSEVMNRTDGNFYGNIQYEYEPYYSETKAIVGTKMEKTERLPGNGVYIKTFEDNVGMQSISETKPARDAK